LLIYIKGYFPEKFGILRWYFMNDLCDRKNDGITDINKRINDGINFGTSVIKNRPRNDFELQDKVIKKL
jgi:hypothetical protein